MYVYIRQAKGKEELLEKEKGKLSFFKPLFLWYKMKRGWIKEIPFHENKIYILPIWEGKEISFKTMQKIRQNLENLLVKDMVKTVALSSYVSKINTLKNDLYRQNKTVLDGRTLFSSMILETLEYIAEKQNTIIEKEDVYVLVNDASSFHLDNLKLLAQKVRNLYIITNHIEKFQSLEEYLYHNMGIIINIANNKKKSLRKAKWIVNFDFPEELLEKYNLCKTAILMNIEEKIEMKHKIFNGALVNMLEIKLPEEIENYFKEEDLTTFFSPTILYESLVIKYGKLEGIRNQLKKDTISISCLIGNKGKLSKEEYTRVMER